MILVPKSYKSQNPGWTGAVDGTGCSIFTIIFLFRSSFVLYASSVWGLSTHIPYGPSRKFLFFNPLLINPQIDRKGKQGNGVEK